MTSDALPDVLEGAQEARIAAGVTDYDLLRAAVFTLEAFRLMNAGRFWLDDLGDDEDEQHAPAAQRGRAIVPSLLRAALAEYERRVSDQPENRSAVPYEYPPALDLRLLADNRYGFGGGSGPDGVVMCKVCGDNYMHPVAVEANAGGKLTAVDADGVHHFDVAASDRGVLITVVYDCESGHRTLFRQQFSKGRTYVSAEADAAKEIDEYGDWFPRVIWRD